MLWSSNDNQGETPLDQNYSFDDVSDEAIVNSKEDLVSFFEKAEEALGDIFSELDQERMAHDFWLSRNGHGAGFFDGDYEEAIGELLQSLAQEFEETTPYVGDDNKIYLI
jgi:hypothetical protein